MTFPHKEEFIVLESFARRQVNLFAGAADHGTYLRPAQLNVLRQNVRTLKQFYGGRSWSVDTMNLKQSGVRGIKIPFEIEGERARGANLDITVGKTKRGKLYSSITITHFDLDVSDVPALNTGKDITPVEEEVTDQTSRQDTCEHKTQFEGRCYDCGCFTY